MFRFRNARGASAVALLAALALVGCGVGSKGPQGRASVSGKVTYKGTPLNGGWIVFTITKDTKQQDGGPIRADGTYTLTNAPVGPVKVRINAMGVKDLMYYEKTGEKPPKSIVPPELNKKYDNDESTPLTFEVIAGVQEGVDFEIK